MAHTQMAHNKKERAHDEGALAPRLRLAVMRLARRLRQQAPEGVTPSQLAVLSTLDRGGAMSLGRLAAAERVTPPSLTRIVDALEERGLIERRADEDDRRRSSVGLTRAGNRFVQQSRKAKTEYLTERLSRLEKRERDALEQAVGLIEQMLEEEE